MNLACKMRRKIYPNQGADTRRGRHPNLLYGENW